MLRAVYNADYIIIPFVGVNEKIFPAHIDYIVKRLNRTEVRTPDYVFKYPAVGVYNRLMVLFFAERSREASEFLYEFSSGRVFSCSLFFLAVS